MAGAVEIETASPDVNGKMDILTNNFDAMAVVMEPLPPVVTEANGGPSESEEEEEEGVKKPAKKSREIVLGRNVHTTCLDVTEPEANDEFTGDKEAYMAGVLARYRKNLMERTKHHLGKKK